MGGWNTSSVANMRSMFEGATAFNGNLSGWNTASVTNMDRMFYQATAFNGNLSGWNTASVTNMQNMFDGATAFDSNLCWNIPTIANTVNMFRDSAGGCVLTHCCQNCDASIKCYSDVTGSPSGSEAPSAFPTYIVTEVPSFFPTYIVTNIPRTDDMT